MPLYSSDKNYDATQSSKTTLPKKFQQVGADAIARLRHLILNHVKGGPGIKVERVGDATIVSLRHEQIGWGGSTANAEWMKTATTKAGLPEPVAEVYFGRVTAGDDKGMVCVRNEDNDGWDAFTHFE